MALIQFVQNYQDLSTDRGYQFKFNCDHCNNGFMTGFQASAIGMAESALKVAGDLFGGMFASAGASAFTYSMLTDTFRSVAFEMHVVLMLLMTWSRR